MSRPWMPLYVADYGKDTGHLSAAEHGAYLLLTMHYWATGGLPDDDRQLSRIARMTAGEWKRARPVVQAFFYDGWKHKRIDKELAKAAKVADSNASKAAAAANARWANAPSNASGNAPSIAQACSSMPTSQPQSHLEEKEVSNFRRPGEEKRKGWSPPRHGATSTRNGVVYVLRSSDEWKAYADDYREAKGCDPPIDAHGGRWFKTAGEPRDADREKLKRHMGA